MKETVGVVMGVCFQVFFVSSRFFGGFERLAFTSVNATLASCFLQVFRPNGPPAANYPVEVIWVVVALWNAGVFF